MSRPQHDNHLVRNQSEARELPGLRLTAAQASRFWSLSPDASRVLLDRLVEARVLQRTPDGYYVRAGSVRA